ncbi:MAG: hypothetical protein KBT21_08655 [Treponema sp.]|nr:hypothetical protein [Candidatus Treponema merdequi]
MEKQKYSGYGYHGGGRPKSENAKKKNLCIRLTEEQLNELKKNAEKENKSVTDFILFNCIKK